jgi:hypothetical protein
MRVNTSDKGITTIVNDTEVTSRVGGLDVNAPFWTYDVVDHQGKVLETVTVDVRKAALNLDTLAQLYSKALSTRQPADAAGYIQHKNRLITSFNKRDQTGSRYE